MAFGFRVAPRNLPPFHSLAQEFSDLPLVQKGARSILVILKQDLLGLALVIKIVNHTLNFPAVPCWGENNECRMGKSEAAVFTEVLSGKIIPPFNNQRSTHFPDAHQTPFIIMISLGEKIIKVGNQNASIV